MSGKETRQRQNVKWVEVMFLYIFISFCILLTYRQGVRGLASILVVITHLARAWDYPLFWPVDSETSGVRLLQLPILRLPFQGRIGVMMFSFLTGYVCAIKPLRQIKSGNHTGALTTLAKSAFRRPPRLIMPATIALVIAWLATQLDGFNIARVCDSDWLRDSSPAKEGGLGHELLRLLWEFQNSWVNGNPVYDAHQWALLPLLRGAFLIYGTLFATCYMKFRMRALTVFILWAWFWCSSQWKTGKHNLPPPSKTSELQFSLTD
jgi:peptidoglycan/LPS O-acetylase OafA/YrhL